MTAHVTNERSSCKCANRPRVTLRAGRLQKAAAALVVLSCLPLVAAAADAQSPTMGGLTKSEIGQFAFYFGFAMLGIERLLALVERAMTLRKTMTTPMQQMFVQPLEDKLHRIELALDQRFKGLSDRLQEFRRESDEKIKAQGVRTDQLLVAVGQVQGQLERMN